MDPRLFLQFAKALASASDSGPAEYRTSISRSYYAAYLVAVAFLKDHAKLMAKGGGDKHSAIKNGLLGCKDSKQIGIKLDTLHTQRKNADYDMTKKEFGTQIMAQAASKQSQEILDELGNIEKSGSTLAAFVAEIKAWATSPVGKNWLRSE